MYTQQEVQKAIIPILQAEGKVYRKFNKIMAREATGGEVIRTITKDGIETINQANPGDYIVQNQTEAKEQYIIRSNKFEARYVLDTMIGDSGIGVYKPIGKVIGIKMDEARLKELSLDEVFYFMASWGAEMIARKGDYMVCPPDLSEVYRIAEKEFYETYEIDEHIGK
ncbi:MAG: hypothetical protein AAF990_17000 [Bacteroidota bacterium]